MKYLFVLGRNIELSIAELKAFFRKNNTEFREIGLERNGLLIETSFPLKEETVKKLGGTISLGEVLAEGEPKSIFEKLNRIGLHNTRGNKLNYVIHNFNSRNIGQIEFYIKKRFRSEKLKATEKKLTGNIKMQTGESIGKVSSALIDEQYFAIGNCFGRIFESTDYGEMEKRDMEKPARRNELAISPRLAKILINLSELNESGILLDPFCGVGVILEEALLQGIKATGIDKDKNAIEDARKNLEWFSFKKENYRLICGDSSKVSLNGKFSGIATEPDLGQLKKSFPMREEARKTVEDFEKLMVRVLKNLGKKVEGKIAFTAPLIQTGKKEKRISCDFEKIAKSAGLKILEGPIEEFREGQIVGRSVVVMRR